MARLSEHGIRLSSMSPFFLNSNSTSHIWPFSAVAELIDNSSDPGVCAKQIWIDVVKEDENLCLTFTDNGNGMTPSKLHKMLSFGFTEKGSVKASQQAIGVYGNGFKSGSMRLGRDALIFTKNGGCQSVGLLSQTYLEKIKAQAVIVPIVPFNQQTKSLVVTEDSEASLAAILQYSIVDSKEGIHKHFDSIPSKKGTKILIWNLRRAKDGKLEIDFDSDEGDFRMPEIQIEELKKGLKSSGSFRSEQNIPDMHYSLRAYLSILYLKPRTQIFLRGKKILVRLVSKRLVNTEHDVYKPHFSKEKVKVTFGLNPNNKDHYGIMMYHKNRLIKAYEKVGCQLKTSGQRSGMGVVGIIECNFLKPAHNKQDFEYTKEYSVAPLGCLNTIILTEKWDLTVAPGGLTLGALGLKLNDYWREVTEKKAREREFRALDRDDTEVHQNNLKQEINNASGTSGAPMWLQCEECLKWRSVPSGHYKVTPETWNCSQNPNSRYRSCSSPEEAEDSEELLAPSYSKNHKKVQHHKSRKREKSAEVQNSQKQAAKYRSLLRSSERVQPSIQSSHTPDFTANQCHTDEETPEDDETSTGDLPEYHKEVTAHTNDDEQTQIAAVTAHTEEEHAGRNTFTKEELGLAPQQAETKDQQQEDKMTDVHTQRVEKEEQESTNLSCKRKSDSSFYPAIKKRHLLEDWQRDAENQAENLQKRTSSSQTLPPDQIKTDSSNESADAPHLTPISHAWSHSAPSTQTVTVSPLSRTEGQQLPPEGGDREANVQRLAVLEKEAQRLRSLLGLETPKTSQSTMTTTEMSAQGRAASCRNIGCQTDAAESSTSFTGPVQAAGPQGLVMLGQRVICEPKDQPWQNGPRREKTEGQSRLRDAHSQSHEDSRSTQENLRDIRNNVVVILTALLPQLDLTGISLETGDVDNILEQIIDVNSLRL